MISLYLSYLKKSCQKITVRFYNRSGIQVSVKNVPFLHGYQKFVDKMDSTGEYHSLGDKPAGKSALDILKRYS